MNHAGLLKRSGIFALALACVAALLAAVMLTGCSEEEDYLIVGTESDDALSMVLVNETGTNITGIAVAQSGQEDAAFSDNMMGDEAWEADAKVKLYCDDFDASATTSEGDELALKAAYDICLTFEDGTTHVLHSVTFEEAEEVSVRFDTESGLAYLKYDDNGSEATTLEAEKAIVQQEAEAKAAEEAAAKAAEEQAAAEAKAAEEAAAAAEKEKASQSSSSSSSKSSSSSSSSSKSSGSSSSGSSSSGSGSSSSGSSGSGSSGSGSSGSGSSQSEDSCVDPDDLILR